MESEKDNLILEILTDRKLNSHFESFYKKSRLRLSRSFIEVKFDFYKEFLLEAKNYNHILLNGVLTKKKVSDQRNESLLKLIVSLYNFFFTELVSISLHSITDNDALKGETNKDFIVKSVKAFNLPKLLPIIQKNNNYSHVLGLYISLYDMYIFQDKVEYYLKYKEKIIQSIDRLNPEEISFHYSNLISYCTEKAYLFNINEFKIELFNVFKELLEKGYYKSKKVNYLRANLFRSIVLASLNVKQFKWCQTLINNCHKLLDEKDKDNMKNFGYANFYFEMGDYPKTLKYINKINIDYFIYLYDIKNLTVKTYFELGYFDELISFITSYRSFLKNNLLVSDIRRKRNIAFLQFVEKIILKSKKSRQEVEFLKHQLDQTTNVSYKDWLMEKINKLINIGNVI